MSNLKRMMSNETVIEPGFPPETPLSYHPRSVSPILNDRSPQQTNSAPSSVQTDAVECIIPIEEIADFDKYYKNLKSAYHGEVSYESITLDLIAIYLKGQKILYIESKTFCEQFLYYLMLPAIFISAVCTVLSVSLKGYSWGSVLVAGLTGTNSFILSVVTYLKLDAKSEAHRTASYQFDKLQTMCEFHSGRSLLVKEICTDSKEQSINDFVKEIEKKVVEIKDVNQFAIPEQIRHRYASIYGTNVFAIVKKYKTDRMLQAQRLLIINKKIEKGEWYKGPPKIVSHENIDKKSGFKVITNMFTDKPEKIPALLEPELDIYTATEHELRVEKERLINLIIEYRKISSRINNAFNKEIENYVLSKKNNWINFCSWLKT
jgi:hypothetical protein